MAEKTSSNKDSFGYLYHLETLKQGKVGLTADNKPVTAYVDGVKYENKVYNLPLYDRDTGDILTHQQALSKFKPQIEAGEIESFPLLKNKFKEDQDDFTDHPANIRAREEHHKIEQAFQQALDPNLISHQNIRLPSSKEVQYSYPQDPLSVSRTGEMIEKGFRDVASSKLIYDAIKIAERQHKLTDQQRTSYENIVKNSKKETFASRLAAFSPHGSMNLQYQRQLLVADAEAVLNPDSVEILLKRGINISAKEAGIEFSPETINFFEGSGSTWEDFTAAPITILTELTLTQAPHLLASVSAAIGGGLLAGPAGFISGGAVVAGRLDYINRVQELLQRRGVDTNNPSAIREAMEDPEFFELIKTDALKGSSAVAAASVAGSALYPLAGPVAQKLAVTAINPFIESGGEALAQKVSEGEVYDPRSVYAEGMASGVPSVIEAAGYYGTQQPNVELEADPDNALPLYAANPEDAQQNQFPFPDESFSSRAKNEIYSYLDPNEKRSEVGLENVEIGDVQDYQDALGVLTKKGLIKKSELEWSGLKDLTGKIAAKGFSEYQKGEEIAPVTLQDIENQLQEHDIIKLMTTNERRGGGEDHYTDDEIRWDENDEGGIAEGYGTYVENFNHYHNGAANHLMYGSGNTLIASRMAAIDSVGSMGMENRDADIDIDRIDIVQVPNYTRLLNDYPLMSQVNDEIMNFYLERRDEEYEYAGGDPSVLDENLAKATYPPQTSLADRESYTEDQVERILEAWLEATELGFQPWHGSTIEDVDNDIGAQTQKTWREFSPEEQQKTRARWNIAFEEMDEMLDAFGYVYDENNDVSVESDSLFALLKLVNRRNAERYYYVVQNPEFESEYYVTSVEGVARDQAYEWLREQIPASLSSGDNFDFDRTEWGEYLPENWKDEFSEDPIGYVELSMQIKEREGRSGVVGSDTVMEGRMKKIGRGTGHGFPSNTFAHIRGGYLTEAGERKFRLAEVQSDWIQNRRKRIAEIEATMQALKSGKVFERGSQFGGREYDEIPLGQFVVQDGDDIYLDKDALLDFSVQKIYDTSLYDPNKEYTLQDFALDKTGQIGTYKNAWEEQVSEMRTTIESDSRNADPPYDTEQQLRTAITANEDRFREQNRLDFLADKYVDAIDNYYEDLEEAESRDPVPFEEDWIPVAIKNLMVHMVDQGVDVLEIPWGKIQTDLYGNGKQSQGTAYFYNRVLMNRLKFLKSFGIVPENVLPAPRSATPWEQIQEKDRREYDDSAEDIKVERINKEGDVLNDEFSRNNNPVVTLQNKEINLNEYEGEYFVISVPALFRNLAGVSIYPTSDQELIDASERKFFYSESRGDQHKIIAFESEKQANKVKANLIEELRGNTRYGFRRIVLNDKLKNAIREGNLPLFSESWRSKLKTATRPEIKIKTQSKKQTILDLDRKAIEVIPDDIKDVMPFTGKNKESFAAGLDGLLEAGMPKILLNSIDQYGQLPSKNKSGVTYPDAGIIAVNQKELADALKGEENARWSVTSLLAHEFGHIPDAINRMSKYNDGKYSEELLSATSPFFFDQDIDLNTVADFSMQNPDPIGFGPITQEAYEIYNNDVEGLGEFLAYPMDDWKTAMTDAAQGNTNKLEWFLGEVQAQMSALYRTNPELLAKHAPEAYKFYRRLDYVLSQKKNPNVGTAKSIRKHFRSSSPTRGKESLRSGNSGRDGGGSSGEGGALYGMGQEGQDKNRFDNG